MSMDPSRVAIVIPAYNETATIGTVVEEVSVYGMPIVVDDASQDDTSEVSGTAGAIVVRNPTNGGYDDALNAGFVRAEQLGYDFVVTFDGDGQHDAKSLAIVLHHLASGAELVVGVRPRKARVAEWLFGLAAHVRYGIRDPLCGLKGYQMDLYRAQGYFDSSGSIGTELMFFGLQRGCRIVQVDVPVRQRNGSTRFGRSLRSDWKILRAMLSMLGRWEPVKSKPRSR